MGCVHCFEEHPAGEACPAQAPKKEGSLEGQRHGPLLLRRRLGTGSLGTVYLAEYPPTGSRFAVKELHPHLAACAPVRARFNAFARAVEKVVHPNVTRVLDVRPGRQCHPCLLMEYVDGVPLARLPLPLAPAEALELLGQVLDGLEAAHARGVVHGGLRPDHLFLTRTAAGERRVKILELGMSGVLLGRADDARADLFALAVVGYQLVTGQLPFPPGQPRTPPPPPHTVNPCVPPGLSAVLLRALAPRAEERYPDAAALRAALASSTAEPPEDSELAQLLARTASLVGEPYSLLGAAPSADFVEVRRRAEAALKRLDTFRPRPLPLAQHRALEALRSSVEAAVRTLGNPLARVGFDAVRGNVAGISRCLAAGLSEAEVEPLRQAFLSARPGLEARARALFTQGHSLELRRALVPALERYAEALALDPLNVAWQRHYLGLCQRVRPDSPSPLH